MKPLSQIETEKAQFYPQRIGGGSRVDVHKIISPADNTRERILRIPKDPAKDEYEVINLKLLKIYFKDFLPNPTIIHARVRENIRKLVACDYIDTCMTREEPGYKGFRGYLDNILTTVQEKVTLLMSLRRFIDACKACYAATESLPDLVGKGNLVFSGTKVYLLDINNISGCCEISDKVCVPLDEKGWPIFDMSLRLLYHLEKHLLSYTPGNYSSQKCTQLLSKQPPQEKADLSWALRSVLVKPQDRKRDPFYGAVRYKDRRKMTEKIILHLTEIYRI